MSLRLLAIAAAFVLAPTAYVADPIIIKYSNAEQNKWRKAMAPVFGELAKRQRGQALVAKVDTDRNPGISSRFAIRSIPTLVVFRDGREATRQVGAVPMSVLEQLVNAR